MCRCLSQVTGEAGAGLMRAYCHAWTHPPCEGQGGKTACRMALGAICLVPTIALIVGIYLLALKLRDM